MGVKKIKLGHNYYYVLTIDELKSGNFRGKNVVIEGVIEDKPKIEFLPMELPSYRATFHISGLKIEFSGTPNIGRGETVKVYGRFLGDGIIAKAIETERILYVTEE
ncbi:MAG: GTP-binding protein [Thermococcales archaeon 44_46]|jgi:hypothetical protein|nr:MULTISPECIES: hypothetical protein [Thermococcus]KUJ99225.1 MAG: GTP-binding protein [Thermococcales archaeon 44_46]MCA6214065.1 GTP-binding protein [Thermococcus bergensis]MDK2854302.1 hypothetical protein [Thermococcaceae archaeon]HIH73663.1 GTP-binding protein [Thermococcaceae archaeon]